MPVHFPPETALGLDPRTEPVIRGGGALGLGLIVLAVTAGFSFADPSWLPPDLKALPGWGRPVLALAGAVLGLECALRGACDLVRDRRIRRTPVPWTCDYRWDPTGVSMDVSALSRTLRTIFMWNVLLLPVDCLAAYPAEYAFVFQWGVGLFHALPLLTLLRLVHDVRHFAIYGRPRLELESFPILLGQPTRVALRLTPAIRRCRALRVRIQCIEERDCHPAIGSDEHSSTAVTAPPAKPGASGL